jgi:molecular chaperone HscB
MINLFDILGLETTYALDLKALEQAYFAAQRVTHPDRFIGKPETERLDAISKSQLVNDAYETLKNPLTRAEHLLELQGIQALADNAPVPPAVLNEMMELRERIADSSESGVALVGVVNEIRALAEANKASLAQAFAAADYTSATEETIRLQYLGKAMEEAHMLTYRLKAQHG